MVGYPVGSLKNADWTAKSSISPKGSEAIPGFVRTSLRPCGGTIGGEHPSSSSAIGKT